MATRIELGDIVVDVTLKDIKNVHLSVLPPAGKVRISAPLRMKMDTIRVYAISRLDWIKQQQKSLRSQARETPREYLNRESHYVWGRRYLLKVVEGDKPPSADLKHKQLVLTVRPGTDEAGRQAVLERWYRQQLKAKLPALIEKWEPVLGVKVERVFIQRMKTKWGSCSYHTRSIRINTELAKKPPECLEYIVVHELVHLLEPTHNARFVALLDRHLPGWKVHREVLNRLPVRHEQWSY